MKFSCPHCQQHLEAKGDLIGVRVECPSCGEAFVVETAEAPAIPHSDLPPQPPEPSEATPEQGATAPIPPETSDVPPPTQERPKVKPQFRVVSRPQPEAAPRMEVEPHSGPEAPKAKPSFRVVSRPESNGDSSCQANGVPPPGTGEAEKKRISIEGLHNKFNDFTGLEKLEGFSLLGLFSEIFGKHKAEDIEEMFTVGTPRATPTIEEVDTSWPKPWMFFRALAGSIALYLLFNVMWHYFENPNDIPGMMLMGTLAVPLSTLLFFYEVNVRRNISLYQVLKLVFVGGILSLLLTSLISGLVGKTSENMALALAGPVEETAKLLALVLAARSMRYHYKLNGLLMGAAVGTGFAVFESMGYAIGYLISGLLYEATAGEAVDAVGIMKNVIFTRGVLSPLGHIVWTAIAGAALWRVKGSQPFRFSMFGSAKFWHLFLIPVVLHSLWDIPLLDDMPYYGKYLVLGVVAWFIALALLQEGLKELRTEKVAAMQTREDLNGSGAGE